MTQGALPARIPSAGFRLLVGVTAVAAALAAQWLFSYAFERAPFPPYSYSDWFIRQAPGSLATEAIERLGPRARESLAFASVAALLVAGAFAGLVRPLLAPVAVFVATVVGTWLTPVPAPSTLAIAAAFVGAGMAAVIVVLARLQPAGGAQERSTTRRTLLLGGLSGGFLALTGLAVSANLRREPPRGLTSSQRLDATPGLRFIAIDGLSPLITSPEDHYIIDINVQRPRIPRADWELRVNGLVESPLSFRFEELLTFDLKERAVLLQCISNWAAGHLVGSANWSCFPFTSLLERVKPAPSAAWVLAR
ncbi:MAG: molybdopterin-dependent oxidoreductase, partial [Dehalococcoidia bacterium]